MKDLKFKELIEKWNNSWDKALNFWSNYTRLRRPIFITNREEKNIYNVDNESIAFIRLTDMLVIISCEKIVELKLEDFSEEILAHEIGHHTYCPADLTDQGRLISKIGRGLYNLKSFAPLVANLYSDLMVNERLFRINNLKLDKLYQNLKNDQMDKLWNFYMRIYEILWALPKLTLTSMDISSEMEGDSQLANRIIKSYANDWLKGASKFAVLCYQYISESDNTQLTFNKIFDTKSVGENAKDIPSGLTECDDDEFDDNINPEDIENDSNTKRNQTYKKNNKTGGKGNFREPFRYGEILNSLGIKLSPEEIATKYYKELAIPHLIPFPKKTTPISKEPIFEGLNSWDIGSPFEEINWFETVTKSPYVIPGITTYSTIYGEDAGQQRGEEPIDLDIYVDSSGSIPNPTHSLSYLTLCGTIIALSALRAGSSIQVTLWSGKNEFIMTDGFVRNEAEILKILVGYFGGCTAFPIHVLRDTYSNRKPNSRKVHILVISDDGVTTMFDKDEKGNSGKDIAKMALKNGDGGGTFVLNLYSENILTTNDLFVKAKDMGWNIYPVKSWEELVDFSKDFVKKHYNK